MTARARIYWRRLCPLGQKTRQNGRKIFNGLKRKSAALHSQKCKVALGNLHRMHSRKCKVALRAVNGCTFAHPSIDSKTPHTGMAHKRENIRRHSKQARHRRATATKPRELYRASKPNIHTHAYVKNNLDLFVFGDTFDMS